MKKIIIFIILACLVRPVLRSQNVIEGRIIIDSSWRPIAYLSIIQDFEQMNSMSNEMIIEKADIDSSGRFVINTDFLPNGDNLYRIHIARKSDPPASLIIGGKDENHFYLIVNKQYPLYIQDTSRSVFIKDVLIKGYTPNNMLQQVDKIASFLDSASFSGSTIKTELIRGTIYEKLRVIADTCTNPLVSLYALSKSNFEKNYNINQQFYKDYIAKWKKDKTSYFIEFRKKIPSSNHLRIWLFILSCLVFFIIGILVSNFTLKRSARIKNPLHELSVQERKIFALLIEGKSNKEISELLNIGLSTVKSHVNKIYSKLDIGSRKDILNLNLDKEDKLQ